MNNSSRNRFNDKAFQVVAIVVTVFGLLVLLSLLVSIVYMGAPRLNWQFMTSLPSRLASKAGILTAWTGSLWIFGLTALFAIPLGIGAGI